MANYGDNRLEEENQKTRVQMKRDQAKIVKMSARITELEITNEKLTKELEILRRHAGNSASNYEDMDALKKVIAHLEMDIESYVSDLNLGIKPRN